jgi:hypothetical protein
MPKGASMVSHFKPHLINTALLVVSVLLTYTVMEYATFRILLPLTPLNVRPALPDVADVLTQNTKRDYLPHDYVALLGDSYAEGRGDWLIEADGDRNKPFHSANVIHDATGRDVVSFGRGGAGSAEGIVLRPARALPATHCSVFPTIETPSQMFIYFYEGGAERNVFVFAPKVQNAYGRVDAETIDRYLTEYYAAENPWRCHLELLDTATRMTRFLYQHYVAGLDLDYCGKDFPDSNNDLIVGGRVVPAPVLQGVALALPDDSIRLSLEVFDRSLSWLRHRFAQAPATVVYIPAPVSIYRFKGDTIAICRRDRRPLSVAQSIRNSDFMSDLARNSAAAHGMDFLDARPALRAAGATSLIHGPRDWDHLNETGYRALGQLIVPHVEPRHSN